MSAPAATAACVNPDCTELDVPKDMSTVPPGWTYPILCGACGDEIPFGEPDPEA